MSWLRRLIRRLQSPPTWRWLCCGRLWQRVSPDPLWQLPVELLQQLHWWLVAPLRRGRYRPNAALPWDLRLRACWLNSYKAKELALWWAAGVRSWDELSTHTPDNLASRLHLQRRQKWPGKCRPALELLSDKAALLALTPSSWQSQFLRLKVPANTDTFPDWWWDSLYRDGLVLKPLRGHAGRGVVRFRWEEDSLSQEGLFHRLPHTAPAWQATQPASPDLLHVHWQRITGRYEPALATPYLKQSPLLPDSNPSLVMRVITGHSAPDQAVRVIHAWLEAPLNSGLVIFLSIDGQVLPNKPGEPMTHDQTNQLKKWQELIISSNTEELQACLDASITMHHLLPPIDQVAWDWIPAKGKPQLLEGNGEFGLLVPQLFQHLRESQDTKGAK